MQRTRVRCTLVDMTQTMSRSETLTIQADDGDYLGEIALDLSDDIIDLDMVDEEGTRVALGLSIAEAEQLIAKLAVKVAQARMAA